MDKTRTRECKKCHRLLPSDSFRLNRGYFEYTCRECQNIRDRLRKREIVKNNADENINICPEKHKNGNLSHVSVNDQKRRITPHHFRAYTFFLILR